jgi:hypothetical protein
VLQSLKLLNGGGDHHMLETSICKYHNTDIDIDIFVNCN